MIHVIDLHGNIYLIPSADAHSGSDVISLLAYIHGIKNVQWVSQQIPIDQTTVLNTDILDGSVPIALVLPAELEPDPTFSLYSGEENGVSVDRFSNFYVNATRPNTDLSLILPMTCSSDDSSNSEDEGSLPLEEPSRIRFFELVELADFVDRLPQGVQVFGPVRINVRAPDMETTDTDMETASD
jgi:hypothetical protein